MDEKKVKGAKRILDIAMKDISDIHEQMLKDDRPENKISGILDLGRVALAVKRVFSLLNHEELMEVFDCENCPDRNECMNYKTTTKGKKENGGIVIKIVRPRG